jgi:DNA-binding MarR family transcriptional regulator
MPGESIGYLLTRAHLALRQELDAALRPYGLTVLQIGVLAALKRSPGQSNADLARAHFVTPQTMSAIVATLEAAGLIARSADAQHGRILRTELTRAGRQALEKCRPEVDAVNGRMLKNLPASDRDRLRALLQACVANLTGPRS